MNELEERSLNVRRDVVKMLGMARSGNLSSSLAAVDILVWLYGAVLDVQPKRPLFEERDRFVLSHKAAAPALYAVLAERGFFRKDELWDYRRLGSMLQTFPEYRRTPGVDVSCGASGMGLGIALGLALALRARGSHARVFCLTGSMEMGLGSTWETFEALDSVSSSVAITLILKREVARNGAASVSAQGLEAPLLKRLELLGWPVIQADGHDMAEMGQALSSLPISSPGVLLLHTLAGKGIPSLEASFPCAEQALDRQTTERLLGELEGAAL
ncbi:MAG: transketolase [Fretibacterium sp.]|nr:transketolase [Fretibacterium sp.]